MNIMQRLTNSLDGVSGQWSPCRLYTEQKWNATLELFAIYMQNDASQ